MEPKNVNETSPFLKKSVLKAGCKFSASVPSVMTNGFLPNIIYAQIESISAVLPDNLATHPCPLTLGSGLTLEAMKLEFSNVLLP